MASASAMLRITQTACRTCAFHLRYGNGGSAEVKGLEPNEGLMKFIDWLDARGVKQAAVTNAPKCVPPLL